MLHYVAIVEDAGPHKAIGVWFPDLPGCFSAGDDVDEALRNAEEAFAEAEVKDGRVGSRVFHNGNVMQHLLTAFGRASTQRPNRYYE